MVATQLSLPLVFDDTPDQHRARWSLAHYERYRAYVLPCDAARWDEKIAALRQMLDAA